MTTGGWIFSILAIIILLLALVVTAIAWIASIRRGHGHTPAMSAREILDRRLASGEITAEQYEQLRQTLGAA